MKQKAAAFSCHRIGAFVWEEHGEAELAYVLILGLVVLPLYPAVQQLFQVLLRYYEITSFFVTLPFP